MNKLIMFFGGIFLPFSVSAFVPGCFTEYSDISPPSSSPFFVSTESRDDLFFTQNNILIPSRIKPITQSGNIPYTLTSSISTFPLNQSYTLLDDIPETSITIDPIDAPSGFSLTLDFSEQIPEDGLTPVIDVTSETPYMIEISRDMKTFVPIRSSDLTQYSYWGIRITFPKGEKVQSSVTLRTLRFERTKGDIYLISPNQSSTVRAYRSWVCDGGNLFALKNERDTLAKEVAIDIPVSGNQKLIFTTVKLEGKDSDSDGVIDMRDNCVSVSNSNQLDRNYDGIGDACSDDDRDGVIGSSDNCPTVSNPDQKDINANNIGDACEFDSDTDGVSDGIDNCIRTSNPDQKDSDSDGIGDSCDNCKIFNPDQLDLDGNNIGDTCTDRELFEKTNDADSDGILDFTDNCKKNSNPDQKDNDSDGIGDACDNCGSIKNPNQEDTDKNNIGDMCEDTDKDGIDGWRDNCPAVPNPDQADANNNTLGNACEDTDSDRIFDKEDNCPVNYNPDQKNTDGDTLGNACDSADDRVIESNKTLFMIIFAFISLLFIGGIIYFFKKLKL